MTADPGPAPPAPRRKGRTRFVALVGLLAVAATIGVVYGTAGGDKARAPACRGVAALAARLDPLVRGEVAALALKPEGRLVPVLAFTRPDGQRGSLADFKGRTVLLNLWATWCIPCRQEMPALDRLQARLGGPTFQVVAVNVDTAKLDRPKQFLADAGITHLPLYADPSADAFQVLRADGQATGLPTTLLVDPQGCEIGALAGGAPWDSDDAVRLIQAAIADTETRGS